MYKCAIVGVSGGRARGHAEAYKHIARGQLVAVSTRNVDNLNRFGDAHNVQGRYTDYREMFDQVRPDLVHVNTPPDVRLEVMEAAERAGVAAMIVEKPLAIQGEDYLAIRDFAQSARLKVAINHQLHYHPRRLLLQQMVHDGRIGEVRFVDASARMNMAYQGTHTLQAIGAFMPDAIPDTIFGQVSGGEGLRDTPRRHFAPDRAMGAINFADGSSALLRCGLNAPYVLAGDERTNVHKRVSVYGSRGYVSWSMWGWETSVDGHNEGGRHEYGDEDILGQAAMTEAMFDWMEDDAAVHALNLDAALQDFNIMLKVYMSGLHRKETRLSDEPDAGIIDGLREILSSE